MRLEMRNVLPTRGPARGGVSRVAAGRARCVVLWLALGLVLALPACGGSGAAPPAAPRADQAPPAPVSVVQAARAVLEQYRQAHEVRSMDALAPLYAVSPELVRVWQGSRLTGWDAVRPELAALLGRAERIKLRIDDVTVSALGEDGATVAASVSRVIADGVTSVRVDGVLTLALRRQDDHWVIVAEHFSYPPSPR